MSPHCRHGVTLIASGQRCSDGSMFVVDAVQLQIVAESDEPEAQRPFVQHLQQIGEDRIAGAVRICR